MTRNIEKDSVRTKGKLRPEAATDDDDGQGRVRGVTLHMPWGPSFNSYRVVARFEDGQVALIALAPSREEARQQAEQAALNPPLGARAIATERWVGTPLQGTWRPLWPDLGGFYRAFYPRGQKRPRRRPRQTRWGHGQR